VVILQELALKNFKSFESVKVPFKKGVSAIVGANGSGKSNILDALVFVLGATALKQLRASRLTDLINTNSVENYCKVELKFSNEGKEWIISRMIDKNGHSVVRINDERKTLNELVSMLTEIGMTNDGYNILNQGEVTRVIEKNPIERRQIIDNLAGIREFDEKKEEAEKELGKVDEKIKDTNIVLKERENYLEKLRSEKEAASKFDELKLKREQTLATILHQEIQKTNEIIEESKRNIAEVNSRIEEKNALVEKLGKEREESGKEAEELNKKMLEQNQQLYSGLVAELERKKAQKNMIEEQIKNAETASEKETQKNASLNENEERLSQQKERFEKREEEIDDELKILGENEAKLKIERTDSEKSHADLKGQIKNIENELVAVEAELEEFNEKEHKKEIELNSTERENEIALKRIESLKKTASIDRAELVSLEARRQELSKQIAGKDLHNEIKALENNIENEIGREKEILANLNNFKDSLIELDKVSAKCPICESTINDEKRNALKEKRKASIKEHSALLETIKQKTLAMKNDLEHNKKALILLNELNLLIQKIGEKHSKLQLIDKEMHELNNSIKETKSIESFIVEMKKDIEKIRNNRTLLESKIDDFQKGHIYERLNAIEKEYAEVFGKKQILMHEKRTIREELLPNTKEQLKKIKEELNAFDSENKNLAKDLHEKTKLLKSLKKEIDKEEVKLEKEREAASKIEKQREEILKKIASIEERLSGLEKSSTKLISDKSKFEVDQNTHTIRLKDLSEEFEKYAAITILENKTLKALKDDLKDIEQELAKIGAINFKAAESYAELEKEVTDVRSKVTKLEEEKLAVLNMIESIDVKRKTVFMNCFDVISKNFREICLTFFESEGNLKLTDETKIFESGLLIEVQYKGKNILRMESMSGGEKAITALAFLFSILLYNKSPFYVFDEADAALDKENSSKMARIISKFSTETQFILITHNDTLVKNANQIVGVTLNKDKSSIIGLNLKPNQIEIVEAKNK